MYVSFKESIFREVTVTLMYVIVDTATKWKVTIA